MLQRIVKILNITENDLVNVCLKWDDAVSPSKKVLKTKNNNSQAKGSSKNDTITVRKNCLGAKLRKKMVEGLKLIQVTK